MQGMSHAPGKTTSGSGFVQGAAALRWRRRTPDCVRRPFGVWAGARVAALGLAALIAALIAAPTPAAADAVITLVSNLGQNNGSATPVGFDVDSSQRFAAPNHPFYSQGTYSWRLTSVDIEFYVAEPSETPEATYTVSIHESMASGRWTPQAHIATLTSPPSLRTGVNTFTASGDGIPLQAGWGYAVVVDVINAGGRNPQVVRTDTKEEDTGIIYAVSRIRPSGGGDWRAQVWPLKIAVKGYDIRLPGKVPAPAVSAGTASGTLSVSWNTFPTDTDYDLRYYAGSADPADAADWIEEGETGGHTHTGTATTATITGLAEGTVYRVQVRAANAHGDGPWSDSGSATTAVTNHAPRLLQLGSNDDCVVKTASTAFATFGFPSNTPVSIAPLAGRDQCSGSDRAAPMFEDPDGDTLTYSTSYTLPANVRFFGGIPRIVAPSNVEGGSQGRVFFRGVTTHEATDVRVDVTATDPHGATASTHVVLKGTPPSSTGAPRFATTVGSRNMAVNVPVRWVLPAASGGDTTYTDADGNTITVPYDYAVSGLPAGLTFDAATRTVTGTPTTLGSYQVTYTADDADGAWSRKASPSAADTADAASQTIAVAVAEVVHTATGAPTIAGLARAGETLTASTDGIADAGGLTGAAFALQWMSSVNGVDTDIAGATGTSYALGRSDVGAAVKVRASFTDDAGFAETLTSTATAAVAPAPLRAAFHGLPGAHDGAKRFEFELRFSEEVAGLKLAAVRSALAVTGGRAVAVRRAVAGQIRRVTVQVRPDSTGAVTVALAATADCSAAGAICASDGRKLSQAVTATVPGPAALTAAFHGLPAEHDGSRRFEFEVRFSEEIAGLRLSTVRDALSVTGGRVVAVRRAVAGQIRRVTVQVRPDSTGAVTVALGAATDCSVADAICAGDGRKLSQAVTAAVPGPVVNAPATGAPTIAGTAQVGETLTASATGIADANGLTGATFAYQWVSVRGGTGTDIAGATASTYRLAAADAGAAIQVRVSFTDDAGNVESLTSAATAAVALPALTAAFHGMPAEHDGSRRFEFEVRFSEEVPGLLLRAVQGALSVTGGRVVAVKRAVAGQIRRVAVQVRPSGLENVTIALPATTGCAAAGAICASDGRMLASAVSATVLGPVTISVADAEASEGSGGTVDFTVTLNRAASVTVTVDYATADGTAAAGEDYTAASGTLTFAAGVLTQTVAVALLDDAIDEGRETFTLALSNASGARIADGEATGTIVNTDHMPKAWTARFGRSVAVHVVDAVEQRLEHAPSESWAQLGGHRLDGVQPDAYETVRRLAPQRDLWDERGGDAAALAGHEMTPRQLLLGSAFHLVSNGDDAAGGPRLSAWGRVASSGFDGREDRLSLDGTVTTATLGVDGVWERWVTGLLLAYSEGDGSFTHLDMPGGDVSSSLTSVHPYVAYILSDRVRLWGLVGYGSGALKLELEDRRVMDTDLTMTMGALGVRGALLHQAQAGGFELALRSNVLWMVMDSAAADNLTATEADASRVRLALVGSRPVALEGGGWFTPSLEVGLRHDGGDAETGSGVEVGGSLRYASAWGLSIEASVRGLLAHEAEDYTEWGASGALRFDPGQEGRGFTAAVTPTWGTAASGMSRLWGHSSAAGLAPAYPLAATAAGRLHAELGYGVAALRGRGLLTPYARVALTEGADQAWHLGTRLALAESLNVSVEAGHRQREGDAAAHELALLATLGFQGTR